VAKAPHTKQQALQGEDRRPFSRLTNRISRAATAAAVAEPVELLTQDAGRGVAQRGRFRVRPAASRREVTRNRPSSASPVAERRGSTHTHDASADPSLFLNTITLGPEVVQCHRHIAGAAARWANYSYIALPKVVRQYPQKTLNVLKRTRTCDLHEASSISACGAFYCTRPSGAVERFAPLLPGLWYTTCLTSESAELAMASSRTPSSARHCRRTTCTVDTPRAIPSPDVRRRPTGPRLRT
jgi:hypothetical protein